VPVLCTCNKLRTYPNRDSITSDVVEPDIVCIEIAQRSDQSWFAGWKKYLGIEDQCFGPRNNPQIFEDSNSG
jgi:hypothetical protein